MANTTTKSAPRGTKFLTKAFFAAADEIPEPDRAGVIKATLAQIREDMKAKAGAAKAKAATKRAAPKSKAKKTSAKRKLTKRAPPRQHAPGNGATAET
jgi:hypothetical protein